MKNKPYFFLAFLFILISCSDSGELKIKITTEQIRKNIASYFPIKQKVYVGEIVLENPYFFFSNEYLGIDIDINFDAHLGILKDKINGQVAILSKIYYNIEKGAFFLKDLQLSDIRIGDQFYTSNLLKKILFPLIKSLNKDVLLQTPIYTLNQESKKEKKIKKYLKSIYVENETLIVELTLNRNKTLKQQLIKKTNLIESN